MRYLKFNLRYLFFFVQKNKYLTKMQEAINIKYIKQIRILGGANMKKLYLAIISVLIIALGVTGCSSKASSNKDALSKIKEAGVIRIGTEGTYAPFTFHDSNGKLTGFDVDIAKEVAKRIGVKTEFVETKWDGMIAGLDSNRFDIVVNEVGITKERQQKYDFSNPYIVSKAVLIVRKDDNSIKKFSDLKGKKSAQSLTSNLAQIATANGADLVQVNGFNQAIDLLNSKRVDATVNDSLSFYDLIKQKPDTQLKVVATDKNADKDAIILKKNKKELLDAINKALGSMKADGTYLKISKKWFGTDVSK